MAFFSISNIKLSGVSACVPESSKSNLEYSYNTIEENQKLINTTGIAYRRVANKDVCTSDLCYYAAEKLLEELEWDKSKIDVLIFVTQTPDYILPVTATILQDRLKLSYECLAFDIPLGCSGYVYGMSTIASIMSAGKLKKGLLLVGDTITKITNPKDKSTEPLFGDAGSATAFEYIQSEKEISFHLCSDGAGYKTIHIPDGGRRNPMTQTSFSEKLIDDGIVRNNTNLFLDGMDVFSFGINKAPQTVKTLFDNINAQIDGTDYFIFHQANKLMNEKIRKKLSIPEEKYLYSLQKYGNTSSATIPLTMVTQIQTPLQTKNLNLLLCGFGVGLSWGSVYVNTQNIVCPDLIQI